MTAIPLADAGALRGVARRTGLIRLALGALLVVLLGAAWISSSRLDVAENAFLAPGTSGIVVLDLSASTESSPSRQTVRFFRRLAASDAHAGLVLFSDVAYEALPSNAKAQELGSLNRFFDRPDPNRIDPFRFRRAQDRKTPWSDAFRGGTRISTGLALARQMLRSVDNRKQEVVLISDLDDSLFDVPQLSRVLAQYRADGIPLKIMATEGARRGYFLRQLGSSAFIEGGSLRGGGSSVQERGVLSGTSPAVLVACTLLIALALAANELWGAGLDWRSEP
jgi:hypothetical protein